MSCECDGDGPNSDRAARLNRSCMCRTLDRTVFDRLLVADLGDAAAEELFAERPHLVSYAPVFVSASEIAPLRAAVAAIEAVVRLPGYRAEALGWASPIAQRDFGPRGVLMGYDFHLTPDGPRLIEVNTNAGGAFLNARFARAQRVCCATAGVGVESGEADAFEARAQAMFAQEWALQRGAGSPRLIAIVDDAPEAQHLYPEFRLAKAVLERGGPAVEIADPRALSYVDGALRLHGQVVDLVYNRLVDFAFEAPEHAALAAAYADGAVVVTPNPHHHALYADKRNLILLSEADRVSAWGAAPEIEAALAAIPRTIAVTAANAERLWTERKAWFFKPTRGHASKGVYRGDKLTRRVWDEILAGGYVAQAYAPPSERIVEVDGRPEPRKLDVRFYTYDGEIMLSAARLYQGQTTNMRTPGGGFAPLFVV